MDAAAVKGRVALGALAAWEAAVGGDL